MAVGSTHLPTEMSTRGVSWSVTGVLKANNLNYFHVPTVYTFCDPQLSVADRSFPVL